ncbi:MAG: dihydrofolate reductase [Halioglobus sp.]
MGRVTALAIIVAAADNGVIGKGNALPWHLPDDLRHFKRVTMGKPVLMGRKTYDSIGRPLPGRANIVVTHNPHFQPPGVNVVRSLDEALDLGRQIASIGPVDEVVVIGGAEIYRAALPLADRLYFTEVHANVEGDAQLPPIDWSCWREVSRERHAACDPNPYDFSFVQYERVKE